MVKTARRPDHFVAALPVRYFPFVFCFANTIFNRTARFRTVASLLFTCSAIVAGMMQRAEREARLERAKQLGRIAYVIPRSYEIEGVLEHAPMLRRETHGRIS